MKRILFFFLALLPAMGLYAYDAYDFKYGDLYYNITSNSGRTVEVTYNGKSPYNLTSISIPEIVTYKGTTYGVTSIGRFAFHDCTSLTSVTIPNSVTSIGGFAFEDCTSLTSVTIPNSVTSIGGCAFNDCTSLTSVTIGNNVTNIEAGIFYNCTSLTSVVWNIKNCGDFSTQFTPFHQTEGYVEFDLRSQITSFVFGDSVQHIPAYLCRGMKNLTSITIPNSITSIGGSAFEGCEGVNKVNYIGDVKGWLSIDLQSNPIYYSKNLYLNNVPLTNLVIPDGIIKISNAFAYDTCLISITIPNSVTSIGESAFRGCTRLISITISNNVTSIGKETFRDCSGLTAVTIPNSVTSIGENAFRGCTRLISITIPNNVTSIGKETFRDCSSLIAVTIPNSVTSIGESAFRDCTGLTSITIPNGVTNIETAAFKGCTSIASVVWNAKNYKNCSYDNTPFYNNRGSGYSEEENHFDIRPQITSFVFGDSVQHIPNDLCAGMENLTFVSIGNSVATIGESAFENCTGLTSVVIPNSVTTIEANSGNPQYDGAFANCTGLTSITIGAGVESIEPGVFNGCKSLNSITWNSKNYSGSSPFYRASLYIDLRPQIKTFIFGDSVQNIPAYICAGMNNLISITISDGVKNIGEYAFEGCTNLPTIMMGNGVKGIGAQAFSGCDSLKSVHYRGTLADWVDIDFGGYKTYYGFNINEENGANPLEYADSLFIDNKYITEITIPDGVTEIKRCAFLRYNGLQQIHFPNSLKTIGEGAFYECNIPNPLSLTGIKEVGEAAFYSTGITALVLPNDTINIRSQAFAHCTNLKDLNIPHGITSLDGGAFKDCTGIDTLIIGNGVTDIDDQFKGCGGITYLQLGSGVKSIGHGAFFAAQKLKRIVCYAIEPPVAQVQDGWYNGSFYNYNIHVQVPCDNLETYETDAVWGSFKYLECVGADNVDTDGKVIITPSDNEVEITWPSDGSADTYSLVITQDGKEVCTLIFNSNGQLMRIAFAAPSRNGATRHAPAAVLTQSGYRFTVTGLNSGTQYAYAIDVKDKAGSSLNTYKGTFTTTGGTTDVKDITTDTSWDETAPRKVFRDGQVYILRGGKTYTLTGVEVNL